MSGILQNWILKKTGLKVDLTQEPLGDGKILARILFSYDIIDKNDLDSIQSEKNLQNLRVISEWLKGLKIHCDEDLLLEIAQEKSSSAARLLYQLYLTLNERNKKNLRGETVHLQEVEECRVEEPTNPIGARLADKKHVVQWHKDKYAKLTEKCKRLTDSYLTKFKKDPVEKKSQSKSISYQEVPENLDLHFEQKDHSNLTYEDLLEEQRNACLERNYMNPCDIMDKIRKKRHKELREKELQSHMHKILLNEIWKEILEEEEHKYREIINEKLHKQSAFEKTMIEKLLEVQQHKYCILENKRKMDEKLRREKEEQEWKLQHLPQETEFDRILLKHKKKYIEQILLKKLKHYQICWKVMQDLTDISLRNVEYLEEYGEEAPKRLQRDWKNLFLNQKSIMEIVEDVEKIIDIDDTEEEIYTKEIYRQNSLDNSDFDAYLNFRSPWELLPYQSEKFESALLGWNLLGFAVHKILEAKYPKFVPERNPILSKFKILVCVRGLPDLNIIARLQKLLNKRKVKVIQIEDVIEFCKKAAENSSNDFEEIEPKDTSMERIKEPIPEKGKKIQKAQPEKNKKSSKRSSFIENFTDKNVQTPRRFSDRLSRQAELGLQLKFMEEVPSHFLMEMFLEYIKNLNDYDGWALINFPGSFEDALLLEEVLADKKIDPRGFDRTDSDSKKRNSKIVPNPNGQFRETYFETCLTAFITLAPEYDQAESEDEDELSHLYTEQGVNYYLYFKSFDLPFVKHLAKLILGDYSLPRKNSLELFGDTIQYMEAYADEEGSPAGKSAKKTSSTKPTNVPTSPITKNQSAKSIRNVQTQFPDFEEETEVTTEEIVQAIPGGPDWTYVDLPIAEEIEIVLATIWENAETIYVGDFREIFFLLRIFHKTVMPYTTSIQNRMQTFINRPSNEKQQVLNAFQNLYNGEPDDLRDDVQFKAEYHCKIQELRERLYELVDKFMKESEKERQKIIRDNWVSMQSTELINNFINAFQIEMDFSIDTQTVMIDYYFAMISKEFSDVAIPQKILLKKLDAGNFLAASETIWNTLIHIDSDQNDIYFFNYLESIYGTALQTVKKWHSDNTTYYNKLFTVFNPTKTSKLPKFFEPSEELKQESQNILDEYQTYIKGENDRIILRLELLKSQAVIDLKNFLRYCTDIFHKFLNEITNRYYSEIEQIDRLCELLSRAVEDETKIQPELIFDNAVFLIDPNCMCFPNLPSKSPPSLDEPNLEGIFRISQLEKLRVIMKDLAPNGSIPERIFTFVLQDMIVQNAEDGQESMVPLLWTRLTPNQLDRLIGSIFINGTMIDWREFIVFNLELKYPSDEELISMRNEFKNFDIKSTGSITLSEYSEIKLWFEDFSYRSNSIKQLLFDLYKIDDNSVEYVKLLIAFCKDFSPMNGIAKAIQVSIGKHICYDQITNDNFVRSVRVQRVLDEVTELDAVDAAESTIFKSVDKMIHECTSVIIEEIVDDIIDDVDVTEEQELEELESKELNDKEEEEESDLIEEKFSNVQIGFQPRDCPSLIYFLPLEVVKSIMSIEGDFNEELDELYEDLRLKEFNNSVLIYQFLNNDRFRSILHKTSRFMAISPLSIVSKFIETR